MVASLMASPRGLAPLAGARLAAPLALLLLATPAAGFGGLSYLRKPTEGQAGLESQLETMHKSWDKPYTGTVDSVYNMPVSRAHRQQRRRPRPQLSAPSLLSSRRRFFSP